MTEETCDWGRKIFNVACFVVLWWERVLRSGGGCCWCNEMQCKWWYLSNLCSANSVLNAAVLKYAHKQEQDFFFF